jgi:hypothetical protein
MALSRVFAAHPWRKGLGQQTLADILKSPRGVGQVQGPAALAVSRKLLLDKFDQAFVLGHGLPC